MPGFSRVTPDKTLLKNDKAALGSTPQKFNDSTLDGFPSGFFWLDRIIGNTGFLFSRESISEISGKSQTSKTTFMLQVVAYNQMLYEARGEKLKVLWCDYERSLLKQRPLAQQLGVRFDDDFRVILPLTLEGGGQYIIDECKANSKWRPDIVVMDTVTTARPALEYANKLGQTNQPGVRAKIVGEFLRNLTPTLDDGGPAVVLINHLYEKIEFQANGGKVLYSPASNAIEYYAMVRLRLTAQQLLKNRVTDPFTFEEYDEPYASNTSMQAIKTKFGAPYKRAGYTMFFGQGVDDIRMLAESAARAEKKGVISALQETGKGYYQIFRDYEEEKPKDATQKNKLHGFDAVIDHLKENPEAASILAASLNPLFQSQIQDSYTSRKARIKALTAEGLGTPTVSKDIKKAEMNAIKFSLEKTKKEQEEEVRKNKRKEVTLTDEKIASALEAAEDELDTLSEAI